MKKRVQVEKETDEALGLHNIVLKYMSTVLQ
jgi:hypothetical protein